MRLLLIIFWLLCNVQAIAQTQNAVYNSQEWFLAVRNRDWRSADSLALIIAAWSPSSLAAELTDDATKKAFWLNIYNAGVQTRLARNPDLYKQRSAFFESKAIIVAKKTLSLDNIENGILRRSKIKISLGYLSDPFVGRFERQMRVKTLDPRIHFAMNCGAKSCPAIAYYDPEKIDEQLETATKVYLQQEVVRHSATSATIPVLFSWFRADFGNISQFLKHYGVLQPNDQPRFKYKPYDWTLQVLSASS
jgi:Protein of unknown function, DUF547